VGRGETSSGVSSGGETSGGWTSEGSATGGGGIEINRWPTTSRWPTRTACSTTTASRRACPSLQHSGPIFGTGMSNAGFIDSYVRALRLSVTTGHIFGTLYDVQLMILPSMVPSGAPCEAPSALPSTL